MIDNIINFSSKQFITSPKKFYSALRNFGNIHYSEKEKFWLIIGYKEVKDVLANYNDFSSVSSNPFDTILVNADPPIHTLNRDTIKSHTDYTLKNSRNQKKLLKLINILISYSKHNNNRIINIEHDFGIPLSIGFVLDFTNIHKIPEDDSGLDEYIEKLFYYSKRFSNWDGVMDFLHSIKNEPNTLINNIQTNNINMRGVGIEKIFKSLLIAGTETLPSFLSSFFIYLNKHPYINEKYQDNLSNYLFIEEVLRLEGPAHIIGRRTYSDVKIDKHIIPKNSLVNLSLYAANRDPLYFKDPDKIKLDRKTHPLSFGFGIHHCFGFHIANFLLINSIELLFINFPGLRISPEYNIEYKSSYIFRKPIAVDLIY